MQINGKNLNVYVSGKSDGTLGQELVAGELTIAFVHGLGSSQNYYYPLLPQLVKRANCVLMDTEGSALSSLGSEKPTIDSIANDVKSILDEYEVSENVIIVGHSMGGIVASRFAENYPALVSGVVLISAVHPNDFIKTAMEGRVQTVLASNSVLEMADVVAQNAPGSAAKPLHRAFIRNLVSQQSPVGYAAMCEAISKAPIPNYSKIDKPVLILVGEDDKTAPYETCSGVIEKGYTGPKELHKLPGVGHWPCIECDEDITRYIDTWLGRF